MYQRIYVQLTNLLQILGRVHLPQVCQALSLVHILSHNFFFFVEPVLPHCQNQAILLQNAVIYALEKNLSLA